MRFHWPYRPDASQSGRLRVSRVGRSGYHHGCRSIAIWQDVRRLAAHGTSSRSWRFFHGGRAFFSRWCRTSQSSTMRASRCRTVSPRAKWLPSGLRALWRAWASTCCPCCSFAAGTGSRAQQAIAAMDWREFEMLLAAGFRQRGFQVRERGGAGADGGVDLVLVRGGERFLVQCKHWRANAVGVEVVRELYGVMVAAGAAGGYVVTSGTFTRPARDFASGRNIELVDGSDLLPLLRTASVRAVNHAEPISKAPELADAPLPTAAPECPECGTAMVLRTAKRGKSARSRFWGCSRYPRCRGTRAMS